MNAQGLQLMGITKTRTTAYQPHCDEEVERQNRTLREMYNCNCNKHDNDQDYGVFVYNASHQQSLENVSL